MWILANVNHSAIYIGIESSDRCVRRRALLIFIIFMIASSCDKSIGSCFGRYSCHICHEDSGSITNWSPRKWMASPRERPHQILGSDSKLAPAKFGCNSSLGIKGLSFLLHSHVPRHMEESRWFPGQICKRLHVPWHNSTRSLSLARAMQHAQ